MKIKFSLILPALLLIMGTTLPAQEYPVKQITFCDTMHDGNPYWTRDGKSIIFDSGNKTTCHAMMVPATGGNAVALTGCFSQHSQISPDGTKIVFDGDFCTIVQMADLNGGTPERIVPASMPVRGGGFPNWSPDGRLMALQSQGALWVRETATGKFTKVCESPGKVMVPTCWFPGGLELLVDARDTVTRKSDIWKISLDGKVNQQLTALNAFTAYGKLSPDGSMILFSSNHGGNFDVWVMKATGGKPVQLTFYKGGDKNPGFDMEATWSPDGKKIAFSSSRSNYWAIWVMEPNLPELKKKLGITQ